MNINYVQTIVPATSAAVDITGNWQYLADKDGYCIHVDFSGSNLAGTLTLQGAGNTMTVADLDPITISTQSVTSAASHMWDISDASYPWVRVTWTASSGSGTMTVYLTLKDKQVRVS